MGVTDQTRNVRHYVFSNFPIQAPDCPRLRTAIGKKGLNCEELRDRYTGPSTAPIFEVRLNRNFVENLPRRNTTITVFHTV